MRKDLVVAVMQALRLRAVQIPETEVRQYARRHRRAGKVRAARQVRPEVPRLVCLEAVQAHRDLAQGRRGEQDRLPRGQERAVRRERHAEIQRAADLQQLRQLRV